MTTTQRRVRLPIDDPEIQAQVAEEKRLKKGSTALVALAPNVGDKIRYIPVRVVAKHRGRYGTIEVEALHDKPDAGVRRGQIWKVPAASYATPASFDKSIEIDRGNRIVSQHTVQQDAARAEQRIRRERIQNAAKVKELPPPERPLSDTWRKEKHRNIAVDLARTTRVMEDAAQGILHRQGMPLKVHINWNPETPAGGAPAYTDMRTGDIYMPVNSTLLAKYAARAREKPSPEQRLTGPLEGRDVDVLAGLMAHEVGHHVHGSLTVVPARLDEAGIPATQATLSLVNAVFRGLEERSTDLTVKEKFGSSYAKYLEAARARYRPECRKGVVSAALALDDTPRSVIPACELYATARVYGLGEPPTPASLPQEVFAELKPHFDELERDPSSRNPHAILSMSLEAARRILEKLPKPPPAQPQRAGQPGEGTSAEAGTDSEGAQAAPGEPSEQGEGGESGEAPGPAQSGGEADREGGRKPRPGHPGPPETPEEKKERLQKLKEEMEKATGTEVDPDALEQACDDLQEKAAAEEEAGAQDPLADMGEPSGLSRLNSLNPSVEQQAEAERHRTEAEGEKPEALTEQADQAHSRGGMEMESLAEELTQEASRIGEKAQQMASRNAETTDKGREKLGIGADGGGDFTVMDAHKGQMDAYSDSLRQGAR